MTRRRILIIASAALVLAGSGRSQDRPRARPPSPWAATAEAARRFDQLHAMVIAHRGEVVLAEAFRGPPVTRPVNVKSVSKSVVAALTGAAIDRGELPGVDATLGEIAPGLIPAAADPRVAGITIGDLVTLRAGLERTSGPAYGDWVSSPNWVTDALARPIVSPPGGRMLYSTGSIHVLGAVLATVTGESLLAQARQRLGDPLGVEIPAWTRDPQGFYLGGNEMALSPLAMVRFGEMYRQAGAWGDEQVLSLDWVERSFTPRTRSPFSGLAYGYGWFLGRARGHDFALARGYGGQLICVVPDLALTAAITSDPTRPARSGGYFGDLMGLLENRLLPAAEAA